MMLKENEDIPQMDFPEIKDDMEAMKFAEKYRKAKQNQEQVKQRTDEIVKKTIAWQKKQLEQAKNQESFYMAILDNYRQQQPKKVIDLPTVRVSGRKTTVYHRPTKANELLKLAKQFTPEAVKTKETVNWSDMKKHLQFKDGKAIDENGEIVPNVTVTEVKKPNITLR